MDSNFSALRNGTLCLTLILGLTAASARAQRPADLSAYDQSLLIVPYEFPGQGQSNTSSARQANLSSRASAVSDGPAIDHGATWSPEMAAQNRAKRNLDAPDMSGYPYEEPAEAEQPPARVVEPMENLRRFGIAERRQPSAPQRESFAQAATFGTGPGVIQPIARQRVYSNDAHCSCSRVDVLTIFHPRTGPPYSVGY